MSRTQLLAAGLTAKEIERCVRSGTVIPVHRGVYRAGHAAPSLEAAALAAVLASGPGAFLRGPAASHLYGLTKGSAPAPEVASRTEHQIPGVRTTRHRNTDPRDVTVFRAIPITTVPRTLVDLAAVLNAEDLARACHEAGVRYRTTPRHVQAVLARRPRSPGSATLRAVLLGDVAVTLSVLERSFVDR